MRTRFFLFGTLVLLVAAMVGGGVTARPQEGFQLSKDAPVEKEYPAMGPGCNACTSRGANGAAGLATLPTTGQCGGNYVWCDAIPIEILVPQGLEDDRDIFFTIIELHWDDSAGNDMDLRFFDNAQSSGTHEQLGSSESTRNPEIVRVANADLGEYNIVPINFSGANTGYTIKARISTEPFANPNESLAPEPPKSEEPEAEEPEEPEFVAPEDNSGDVSPPPADPTLDPVAGGPVGDDDFDFGFSDLDDRITINADELGPQAGAGDIPITEEDPVSPGILLASLIGAPALLVGSGAAFAWRRRQALPF